MSSKDKLKVKQNNKKIEGSVKNNDIFLFFFKCPFANFHFFVATAAAIYRDLHRLRFFLYRNTAFEMRKKNPTKYDRSFGLQSKMNIFCMYAG